MKYSDVELHMLHVSCKNGIGSLENCEKVRNEIDKRTFAARKKGFVWPSTLYTLGIINEEQFYDLPGQMYKIAMLSGDDVLLTNKQGRYYDMRDGEVKYISESAGKRIIDNCGFVDVPKLKRAGDVIISMNTKNSTALVITNSKAILKRLEDMNVIENDDGTFTANTSFLVSESLRGRSRKWKP